MLLSLAVVEACFYLACLHWRSSGLFYRPQNNLSDYEGYQETRDPLLGWPALNPEGGDRFKPRRLPAYPNIEKTKACLSLYGDSFVYSAEAAPQRAWANLLSIMLGCGAANYGVGGYGTDQSFLRFQANEGDQAGIVILGHLSQDIVRNVNRFRNLISPGTRYGLKPRFILDEKGNLQLIPLPKPGKEDYHRLVRAPEKMLDHEFFSRPRFPYSVTVIQAAWRDRIRPALSGAPWYAPFYRPGHPSGALELTEKILEAFHRLASERGKRSLVLFLPTREDLYVHARTGRWTYQNLIDRTRQLGIESLNAGDGLAAYLGQRDPAELFLLQHFNPEAEWVLAHIVYRYLIQNEYF